jgi:hypothetical protein
MQLLLGKKLSEGLVELVDRKTGEKEDIALENIVEVLKNK